MSSQLPYWFTANEDVIIDEPITQEYDQSRWNDTLRRRISVRNGLYDSIFVMGTDGEIDEYEGTNILNPNPTSVEMIEITYEKLIKIIRIDKSNGFICNFDKKYSVEIRRFYITADVLRNSPIFIPQVGLAISDLTNKSKLKSRDIFDKSFHKTVENSLADRYFFNDQTSTRYQANSPFICYANNADVENDTLYIGFNNRVYTVPIQHLTDVGTHCTFYLHTEKGKERYDVEVDYTTNKPVHLFTESRTGLRKNIGFIVGTDPDKIRKEIKDQKEKMEQYLRPDEVEDKIKNATDDLNKKIEEYKKQNENLTKTNELLTKELANLKVELDRAHSETQTTLKERELFDKEADRQTKRHVSDSENSASIWKSVAGIVSATVGIVATVITCIFKFF